MKLYRDVILEGLNYEQAKLKMETGLVATRKEWDGFHFMFKGVYYIYTKDKELLVDPPIIYCIDKEDWCIVTVDYTTYRQLVEKMSFD